MRIGAVLGNWIGRLRLNMSGRWNHQLYRLQERCYRSRW